MLPFKGLIFWKQAMEDDTVLVPCGEERNWEGIFLFIMKKG